MILQTLLSLSSKVIITPKAEPLQELMKYLMLTMAGASAMLNRKQLRKQMKRMKWLMLKATVKNGLHSDDKSKRQLKNILLIVLFIGLLVGIYFWLGLGWLLVLLIFGIALLAAIQKGKW